LSQPNLYGVLEADAALVGRGLSSLGQKLSSLFEAVAASRLPSIMDLQPEMVAIRQYLVELNGNPNASNVKNLKDRTVAYLVGELNGVPFFRMANSGNRSLPGTAVTKGTGPRMSDAESKLLAELEEFLRNNPGSTGTLRLVIDHPEGEGACAWCSSRIRAFQDRFPEVSLDPIPDVNR